MRFDFDRLSRLAGINAESGALNEASNRTQHDEKQYQDEEGYRWGKNQLNEKDHDEDDDAHEARYKKDDLEEAATEDDLEEAEAVPEDALDPMLEIDEGMLRREILRMKKEKLQENQLRGVIRNEIQGIFDELGINDSSWIYGDKKPTNSKKGRVATAFPGIGFM